MVGSLLKMATPSKRAPKRSGPSMEDEANWEGYHEYMSLKRKKLRDQVDSLGKHKSELFDGVTIYVNGYTHPNADELKEKIHFHGGLYEYALTSSVTHVIASNLPTAKIRKLSSVVCRPEWIVDSIKNGRQLPVDNYLLYKSSNAQGIINFGKQVQIGEPEVQFPTEEDTHVKPIESKEIVKEFYAHSRLHYLSTWSRELKEFTSKVLPTAKQCIPHLDKIKSLRSCNTRAIVHVDVDCFFVSVSLVEKPHLKGKPVAVTHAKNNSALSSSKQQEHYSMSDIASCSYKAREFGVKNGMSVGAALTKCPDLVLIPYDFNKYRSVSQTLYEVLISHSHLVEAVSCDEAFIELTDYAQDENDVMEIVGSLRKEIFEKTGCDVSAGVSHNKLLARIATHKAKPNGQYYLLEDKVQGYLENKLVSSLPGVGRALGAKIREHGIETCGQLQAVSLQTLKERHGGKTGEMLYYYSRGIDFRELKLCCEKKSLSVDMNFGIRLKNSSDAEELLQQLAEEMERRLKESKSKGKSLCLKLKIRKPTASSDTMKYLGHGPCDNISRSFSSLSPLQDQANIGKIASSLLKQTKVVVSDIRGVGLQMTKLTVSDDSVSKGKMDIRCMMAAEGQRAKTRIIKETLVGESSSTSPISPSQKNELRASSSGVSSNDCIYNLPPIDDLDQSVLLELPPDIQDKILNEYSSKSEIKSSNTTTQVIDNATPPLSDVTPKGHAFVNISPQMQDSYVDTLRNNIRKWVLSSCSTGPSQEECDSFLNYVEWLAEVNIEVVYLAFKCLRRVVISQQQTKEWISLFNDSLSAVQRKLLSMEYLSKLDIAYIVL